MPARTPVRRRSLALAAACLFPALALAGEIALAPRRPPPRWVASWTRGLDRGLPPIPPPLLEAPAGVLEADLREARRALTEGHHAAALVRLLQGYRRGLSRREVEPLIQRVLGEGRGSLPSDDELGGRLGAELLMLEGLAAWRRGRTTTGAILFRQALKEAPDLGDAAARLAMHFERNETRFAVMRWADMAAASDPRYRDFLEGRLRRPLYRHRVRVMPVDPVGEAGRDVPALEELDVEVGALARELSTPE